jgi:hypothetical protein
MSVDLVVGDVIDDAAHLRFALEVDRITADLAGHFAGIPADGIEDGVRAEFGRWYAVPVQDFVPIFVERAIRGRLRADADSGVP